MVMLSTWESSRRGGGGVAVRLESTSYWCTYQRYCGNAGTTVTGGGTSGIVECWAPSYRWTYQRCCVNTGPKGSTQERAPPLGNQPENWWAERRSFVSGIPVVFFNAAGALEQVSQELCTMSACLVSTTAWPDLDRLHSPRDSPSPFLPSSPFVPLLAHCRPSLSAFLSLRQIWADYSWTQKWAGFRRRLPGPWPAAWTRGGVGLNCQLKLSYLFFFVESGCVNDDKPSYWVWTVCTVVGPWSSCCQLSLAM